MALIECPECRKQISDKTKSCINCGYPIQTTQQIKTDNITTDNSSIKKFIGYFKDTSGEINFHKFYGTDKEDSISNFLDKNPILSVPTKDDIDNLVKNEKFSSSLSASDKFEIKEVLSDGKFSCPSCNSKFTNCKRKIGCAIMIIIFISLGLGLIMIPFLPYHCECELCGNKWKS